MARYLLGAIVALLLFSSSALADEIDVIVTNDGKTYPGRILRELSTGVLFRTLDEKTVTISFEDVEDVKKLKEDSSVGAGPKVEVNPTIEVKPTMVQQQQLNIGRGPLPYEHMLKSPTGAFFMSLLLPGWGCYYYGEWGWVYTIVDLILVGGGGAVAWSLEGPEALGLPLIVHGILGVVSGIHAAVGTSRYNDRLIDDFYREHPEYPGGNLEFHGFNYRPVPTPDTTFHTLNASWSF